MATESVDVTVIGAGWSGLAALKTYHQMDPSASILLLDSAASVGGVWAKHRLYAGLKSNNMLGTYEFSDFPMDESFGVKPGEHIPGTVIQRYMEQFLEHFQLTQYLRLNTQVRVVERNADDTWTLTLATTGEEATGEEEETTLHSKKIIVCTGITSRPYLPSFPGQETFDAPIFHNHDLLQNQDGLLQPNKHITVFGGTKSAWDAAYAAATAGATVDMIIRDGGHGPCWMAPPYVTPLKKWLEKLVTTRLLTFFSPCIWGDADRNPGPRNFLHGTWLGRKIVDTFWSVLENDVIALNNYAGHPDTAKLQPWISPFWIASSLSILNYPTSFFDLVREGKIRVHVAHITHLSPHTVHITTNTTSPQETSISLQSDALIACSGWKATPNITFHPPSLPTTLGFPWAPDPLPSALLKAADTEILTRFPRLATPPSRTSVAGTTPFTPLSQTSESSPSIHPFRLARFMVPPALAQSRSIAFMGITMTINTTMIAQAQALWIAAYFTNRLTPTPRETCPASVREELPHDDGADVDLLWETALHSQFGVHRYPGGFGRRNPDFVFDALPYVDLLLGDLGVGIERKGGMRWFEPYGVEDYRGLVEEFLSLRGDESAAAAAEAKEASTSTTAEVKVTSA